MLIAARGFSIFFVVQRLAIEAQQPSFLMMLHPPVRHSLLWHLVPMPDELNNSSAT